ncbi:ABC transporter ATP-binding protein [Gloeocapsa sp. PCC 73106]|uniref:ABC transporter ATP-binding protein n=1 Tax=Gloeocapsa sp. PCC 73106 TaxID=102232 RepID=UPI0002AC2A5D|nr:ABC transporter ATP-binding protein [Gloeocapsa sp. PCC 73106]ELR98565.1 ABC-type multidrug transport system, ATPase and permease component [Gloeocapsa sp. PCC 73106]
MAVYRPKKQIFLLNDWGLIVKLAPYLRPHRGIFVLAIILLIPVALAGAVQPLIVGQAISLLRGEQTWSWLEGKSIDEGINQLIILLLCTLGVRLVLLSYQGFLVQKIGQEITAGIRKDLFTHVTSLATRFFDRTPVGRLITRLTSDVEALGDVFASGAIGILSDLIYMLVITITIFNLEWRLATILVLMLVPVAGLIVYFQQQYRKANYTAREELSKLNSMLQENVAGMNIVQLFGRERFNAEMFRVINDRYRQQIDKTILSDAAVSGILEWISLIAIAAVLWVGGSFVLQDNMSFGLLSAFILLSQRFFEPLRQFADKFTMFQAGFTAIERISELMNEPIEIKDLEAQQLKNLSFLEGNQKEIGEIKFDHVWFGYKPSEYVLKDLNFTIRPGEKVALVGPTGAGKSSIIRLLCRLYEPTKGAIYLDGIDIRELPQAELRRYIGVILQESFIFAGDVKGNIALGEDFSLEEITNAAKRTKIEPFIEQLSQGYDTELRERGTNLSGGQKQLIAFARVAIRNPRVLVLDEATSSLDVVTERQVQQALEELLINRTAIIIAHRLSTIRNVDRILVLKKGEIIESGSHEALLAEGGLYASLYHLQQFHGE